MIRNIIHFSKKATRYIQNVKLGSNGNKIVDKKTNFDNFFINTLIVLPVAILYWRWSGSGLITKAQMKQHRSNNNFIADVVEKARHAVVVVEIINKNFFTGSNHTHANGSGFIVSEDGLIITSAHVILPGKGIGIVNIKLEDNSNYRGEVEEIDVKADLAIIRIQPKNKLPVIPLGEDTDVRPGEWVIAIGSPLALSNTITAGVVSSVQRYSHELKLVGKEDMAYIQTDASLTFGNSGGPLVNLDGEVIGVNAMKVAAGISFAIPVGYVKTLIESSNKKYTSKESLHHNPKRFIGVTMMPLNHEIIDEMKAQNKIIRSGVEEGVLIWHVIPDSPAAVAGFEPGDIAVELNGKVFTDTEMIYKNLDTDLPLSIKVVRNGKFVTLNVTPKQFPNVHHK